MRKNVLLVAVLWVPACGGSSSIPVSSNDAAAVTEPDIGAPSKGGADAKAMASGCDHAAALCTRMDACAPFFVKAAYGDVVACSDRLTKACTQQSLSSGSGMTEANILACEDSLKTATCNDLFANNLPACTFHGTLSDGALCGDGSQCESAFCAHAGDLCGKCAAKGAAGATCASGSNDECQTGLVCSSGKICAKPAAVGGACDDTTQPCLVGTFCTSAKTCALTVAAGQPCPGNYLNFGDGTLCLGQTSAQIGTASAGQPCGLSPGNGLPATLCAPGSVAACTLVSGAIQLFGLPTKGICAAPTQDGYTCAAADICLPGAQCIAGTCQIPSGRYCTQSVDAGS